MFIDFLGGNKKHFVLNLTNKFNDCKRGRGGKKQLKMDRERFEMDRMFGECVFY